MAPQVDLKSSGQPASAGQARHEVEQGARIEGGAEAATPANVAVLNAGVGLGASGATVTVRRTLAASREAVFDAWLDADGMCRWMLPGTVRHCEVMLGPQVGGGFAIFMRSARLDYMHTGEYRIIERPSKLVVTWTSSYMAQQETLVTIELFGRDAQCELVLTHERVPLDLSKEGLGVGGQQMLEKLALQAPGA
ncbi:MAG: SRPBCC domain-containing protein [Burkholderia gladioli]